MDWGNDYFTFSDTNIEYVWRMLKRVHENGWLYMGHRSTGVVPALRHLALAARALPVGRLPGSLRPLTVRPFPLLDRPHESLVIWTTTPWTVPANVAAAVKPTPSTGGARTASGSRSGAIRTRSSSSGNRARSSSAGATRGLSTRSGRAARSSTA
jgi:isoleucyl-tRNA synthetase